MQHRFEKPIEKRRGDSFGTNYFECYSKKLSRNISAFSNILFDFLVTLEMNPDVTWYCERPLETECFCNGKKYSITPDVYVEYKDGSSCFVWVKYSEKEDEPNTRYLWSNQTNENTMLVFPKDIYKGTFYIRNLNYLAAKVRRMRNPFSKNNSSFLRYVANNEPVTIGQLISKGLIDEKYGINYIAELYFQGLIELTNIYNETFSFKTEVISNE